MRDATPGEVGKLSGPRGAGPLPDVEPHLGLDEHKGIRRKGPPENGEIERRTEKCSMHPLDIPPGFERWV